jgi:hypothetical protein
MRTAYIPAYMASDCFTNYNFCRILGDDDEHGITYALQLFSPDLATFETYQKLHTQRLIKLQADRYPNQYVTFRTVMEVIDRGEE